MAFVAVLLALGADNVVLCPQDESGILDLAAILAQAPAGAQVYCCGPEGLLRAAQTAGEQAGPPRSVRIERFGASTDNLRTVTLPPLPETDIAPDAVASAIVAGLRRLGITADDDVAVAFTWAGPPSYRRLEAFLTGVRLALASRTAAGRATCLVMDGDLARSLGRLLHAELGHPVPVISIDGVSLSEFDFVDIGALMPKSGTVPLSIKTMLYHL